MGASMTGSESQTLHTVTYVEAIPSAASEVAGLLKAEAVASRGDTGLAAFDVFQRIDRPSQLVVLAQWKSASNLQAHVGLERVARLNQALQPLLAAPNDRREHFGLAVGAPINRSDGITVVTHVDVVPQYKDDGAAALERLAEDSRAH